MSLRGFISAAVCTLLLWTLILTAASHAACGHSKACWARVSVKRHRHYWIHRWQALTTWERRWARCIADHETRGIPWSHKAHVATGNGYYGSVQFLPATWHAAGGTGLPTDHSLHEQLVRAVRWAHRAGSSQWSTSASCGAV